MAEMGGLRLGGEGQNVTISRVNDTVRFGNLEDDCEAASRFSLRSNFRRGPYHHEHNKGRRVSFTTINSDTSK